MQPISFGERLATAFVSVAATAITLIVIPLLISAVSGKVQSFLLYDCIFSKFGILILVASAITGFTLGAEKMANVFSFFWGTHSVWEEEWFQKVLMGIIVVSILGFVGHLALK
jgi:hypothetical protein